MWFSIFENPDGALSSGELAHSKCIPPITSAWGLAGRPGETPSMLGGSTTLSTQKPARGTKVTSPPAHSTQPPQGQGMQFLKRSFEPGHHSRVQSTTLGTFGVHFGGSLQVQEIKEKILLFKFHLIQTRVCATHVLHHPPSRFMRDTPEFGT